jgi:hypothetical protein
VVDLRKVWDDAPTGANIIIKWSYDTEINVIKSIPRPKPAWEPNEDGETVLISNDGKASPSYYLNGEVYHYGHYMKIDRKYIKRFTPKNIGKRWEDFE